MTAREMLSRRARQSRLAPLSCIAVFLVVALVSVLVEHSFGRKWVPLVVLLGFIIIIAFLLLNGNRFQLRCPCCREDLSLLSGPVSSGRVKCCPYCGKSLDEKLPAEGKPAKSKLPEDELA